MYALQPNRFTAAWTTLGKSLKRPDAILVISAHWVTRGTWVTAMTKPKTIHDFGTVVDLIEDHVFAPLTIDQIQANATAAKGASFCRKCDARFSCRGYRAFANLHERGQAARSMSVYYDNGMDPDEYESRLENAMSPFNEIAADTTQDA
jgi:hypothetical protein